MKLYIRKSMNTLVPNVIGTAIRKVPHVCVDKIHNLVMLIRVQHISVLKLLHSFA